MKQLFNNSKVHLLCDFTFPPRRQRSSFVSALPKLVTFRPIILSWMEEIVIIIIHLESLLILRTVDNVLMKQYSSLAFFLQGFIQLQKNVFSLKSLHCMTDFISRWGGGEDCVGGYMVTSQYEETDLNLKWVKSFKISFSLVLLNIIHLVCLPQRFWMEFESSMRCVHNITPPTHLVWISTPETVKIGCMRKESATLIFFNW